MCRLRERGSSPLARGLRFFFVADMLNDRIIPARAGFTRYPRVILQVCEDHPRSRGVYRWPVCASACPMGSSPLARGLLGYVWEEDGRVRIIPARAGFTALIHPQTERNQDHPRSRGVYWASTSPTGRPEGSSPLARGLRDDAGLGDAPVGIIPARAGFTGAPPPRTLRRTDHPRSRGVYAGVHAPGGRFEGSSPLARGLPPTRAPPAGFQRDHPRSRGVYGACARVCGSCYGSSPLARGLRAHHSEPGVRGGIIPARAGFTLTDAFFSVGAADHPRSRGVYVRFEGGPPADGGSSPLARGLLAVADFETDADGIIPARAGFTPAGYGHAHRRRDHPRSRGVYRM